MARLWAVCGAALLAACNTPSPRYMGETPVEVSVDGALHDVYVLDDGAFVVRKAPTLGISDQYLIGAMRVAVNAVSPCRADPRLRTYSASAMEFRLSC